MSASEVVRTRLPGIAATIGRALAEAVDLQDGRLFLWCPAALAVGIWTYFALMHEPDAIATGILAAVVLPLALLRPAPAVLLALLVAGFALAKFRCDSVATPLIRAVTGEVTIVGTVDSVDRARGQRMTLILRPETIQGLAADRLPVRLKLTALLRDTHAEAGDRISARARLAPIPAPVEPGGYDQGRRLWFEGIGGTGRTIGPVQVLDHQPGLDNVPARRLASLREAIAQRIGDHLDGTADSVAEALITGERAEIPRETNLSLQTSGLFHVLSISGLHMWMVAGSVFWVLRAGLALWPRLALTCPIRKWSAAGALLVAAFYMLLADSGVATTRSFLMIAVVFFAMLVDRPALSLRNLALAAIIVLLLQPEAAVDAGFQMSFMAVLGLVAFHNAWTGRQPDEAAPARHWALRAIRSMLRATMLALATTTIAGGMSSIPAAYHFGRLAPYSLLANGLAFPVIGILVMPMALLATVLMPLGLEAIPLLVMGQGLDLVLAISDFVAELPGARMMVPQPPESAVLLLAAGCSGICLLAGRVPRLAGLVVALCGLALSLPGRQAPDILVERSGANVALRNGDGLLVPALVRKGRFSIEKWLMTDGDGALPATAARRSGWTCLAGRCTATAKGRRVAYLAGDGLGPVDCAGFDIVIASFPLRGRCRSVPLRIDRFDLWRKGAHAVFLAPSGPVVTTARDGQGLRPWRVEPEPRANPVKPP